MPVEVLLLEVEDNTGDSLASFVSHSKETSALNSPLAYSRMALLLSEYGNISSHFKNAPED